MKEKIKNILKKITEFIKNNKVISIITLVIIIGIIVVLIFKDTFADESTNKLRLDCNSSVGKGGTISCTMYLDAVESDSGYSAFTLEKINYDSDLTFSSYEKSAKDDRLLIDETNPSGIVYYSISNEKFLKGTINLGTIKLKVPETAEINHEYTIKLVGGSLAGGCSSSTDTECTMGGSLADAEAKVTVKSDNATLSSLSYDGKTVALTDGTTEYQGTTTKESIAIAATAADSGSTVSGTGTVNLHYGTNEIDIKVRSELGTETNYKLKIKREYEFSTDNYVYNKTQNYLYTGGDTAEATIKSNITLPSGLTGSISNNKYIISYSTETLLSINIINISSSNYTIGKDKIYVGTGVTIASFNSSIVKNGVTTKIFNTQNTEVTSGTIEDNYKLKVYYNSNEIATYTLKKETLNITGLNVDETNKIINRITINTTYSTIISKFNISENGTITVKNSSGTTISNSSKVKTGDVIEIKFSNDTIKYTVSVLGDITGTGTITTGDVSRLYKELKGKNTGSSALSKAQKNACDILNDGSIKINDVARLYRYVRGKITSLEVSK